MADQTANGLYRQRKKPPASASMRSARKNADGRGSIVANRRPSRRDVAIANNKAHRDYGLLYDKPPMLQTDIAPKRQPRERDVNAPPLEREVLKAVWKYLAHHPKVHWITRMNSGTAMADFGSAGMRPIRFQYKRGMSDLLGQMKDGRIICVEVKREGENLQDHQREFLNEVRAANGVAFVARNVDDCIAGIK